MNGVDIKKIIKESIKELYPLMLSKAMEEAHKERQPAPKTIELINSLSSDLKAADNKQDQEIIGIRKDIDFIKEKVSFIADNNKNGCLVHSKAVKDQFDDHEDRLKSIEEWRSELKGGFNLAQIFGFKNILIALLIAGLVALGFIKL